LDFEFKFSSVDLDLHGVFTAIAAGQIINNANRKPARALLGKERIWEQYSAQKVLSYTNLEFGFVKFVGGAPAEGVSAVDPGKYRPNMYQPDG
jgi:hypothetical protein